jgi:hypothetical protein
MVKERTILEVDQKELQAVAQWLMDNGYLKKVYAVEKIQQDDKTYYSVYYTNSDLLKWFGPECKYNELPIYVRPFMEEKENWYNNE